MICSKATKVKAGLLIWDGGSNITWFSKEAINWVNPLFADLTVHQIFQSSSSSEKHHREVILLSYNITKINEIINLIFHRVELMWKIFTEGVLWEDYTTSHTWMAICCWVVLLEVEGYLYLLELRISFSKCWFHNPSLC